MNIFGYFVIIIISLILATIIIPKIIDEIDYNREMKKWEYFISNAHKFKFDYANNTKDWSTIDSLFYIMYEWNNYRIIVWVYDNYIETSVNLRLEGDKCYLYSQNKNSKKLGIILIGRFLTEELKKKNN